MTPQEHEDWTAHMRASRGKWDVDLIHNGEGDRPMLLHRNDQEDETRGVYIWVGANGATDAGVYEGALLHMGEASFTRRWSRDFGNRNDAMSYVLNRVGMSLLMGLIGCA